MNKAPAASIYVTVLCFVVGCSSKPSPVVPSQARVVLKSVQDPIRELCTDDTFHRTDYFTRPLVRFVGSAIELNGAPSSAEELLGWAQKKYKRSEEPTLWVQVSPESMPVAESALLPLVQSLPQLQLRQVDRGFTCIKRKGK